MEQATPENPEQPLFDLKVDELATRNLWGSAGWAKFLAIVVIVAVALMLIAFVGLKEQITITLSQLIPGIDAAGILWGVMIMIIVILGFLSYFLINGAIRVRRGLLHNDQSVFNSGLASLKNYFVMYGVLAIITILLTVIGLFAN